MQKEKRFHVVRWIGVLGLIAATSFAKTDLVPTAYVNAAQADDSGDGTSWATAKQTIQAAVDIVATDGTVWVTNGVYNVGGAIAPDDVQSNRVYFTRPMTLRSVNGPDVTSLLGAAGSNGSNDADSVRGVLMQTNCALLGFTVSDGYTIKTDTYPNFDRSGAGIWMTTDCVVSNCVISGNTTTANGGGVYIYGGLLTHSEISGNQSAYGGGGVCLGSGGVMNDCIVSNNIDVGNGGGGAMLKSGGEVNRTVFKENQATGDYGYGGGVLIDHGGTLNTCLLSGNVASGSGTAGGGVAGTEARLNNCTVVENSVTDENGQGGGGVAAVMSGMIELNNCIVWGNTSPTNSNLAVEDWDTVRNCCVPDGEGITNGVDGCITSDPLFVAVGNYQLQLSSPCVNAGDNAYAPAGTDLAGNTRINDTTIDIGAYEQTALLPTYTITTTPGENGTMSPLNPDVGQGHDQEITIQPAVAYRIDSLTVDGSPVDTHDFGRICDRSAHTDRDERFRRRILYEC
jgi:hypothetical protein